MLKSTTIAVLVAAALAAFGGAPPAHAGQYTQYTCKLPDGTPAATDGWVADEPRLGFSAANTCAGDGGLALDMTPGVPTGQAMRWRWTPPADASLTAMKIYRAIRLGDASGTATPIASVTAGTLTPDLASTSPLIGVDVREAGVFNPWDAPENRVAVSNSGLANTDVVVTLGCTGSSSGTCPGTAASQTQLHAATFTLAENSTPSITNVTGSLASGAVKSGIERLTFSADDTGAGIYRTIVEIDGAPVATTTPNANGGRCVDAIPNDSDDHQFQHQVPCPLHLDGVTVPLDTRSLADGLHLLDVQVEDAAGNRSSAFGGPTTIAVDNTPAPVQPTPVTPAPTTQQPPIHAIPGAAAATPGAINGVGGGAGAQISVAVLQSSQRLVHVGYGRSVTLSGRLLTREGTPIANAVVEIQARTPVRGTTLTPIATVRTDAAGGFRYVLAAGPSRLVRFGYRAHVGDAAFADSTDVDVRVKARLSLKLNHAKLRNGKTIRYSGRVAGRTRRPLVQIQVRNRGRWVNVCVVRARTNGTYTCSYRFRRTFTPTTYTFRALVKTQEGLPYNTAASASRRLRVRP
jgi:hypothetical protein